MIEPSIVSFFIHLGMQNKFNAFIAGVYEVRKIKYGMALAIYDSDAKSNVLDFYLIFGCL